MKPVFSMDSLMDDGNEPIAMDEGGEGNDVPSDVIVIEIVERDGDGRIKKFNVRNFGNT